MLCVSSVGEFFCFVHVIWFLSCAICRAISVLPPLNSTTEKYTKRHPDYFLSSFHVSYGNLVSYLSSNKVACWLVKMRVKMRVLPVPRWRSSLFRTHYSLKRYTFYSKHDRKKLFSLLINLLKFCRGRVGNGNVWNFALYLNYLPSV